MSETRAEHIQRVRDLIDSGLRESLSKHVGEQMTERALSVIEHEVLRIMVVLTREGHITPTCRLVPDEQSGTVTILFHGQVDRDLFEVMEAAGYDMSLLWHK